jgi:hypothetical protein
MIKIEIKTAAIAIKSGIAAKTGRPYEIREQQAWAFLHDIDGKPSDYPIGIRISLQKDQNPYEPGIYILLPASLYVDKFGQLALGRIALRPQIASAAQQKAA